MGKGIALISENPPRGVPDKADRSTLLAVLSVPPIGDFEEIEAANTAPVSRWWLVRYVDRREPVEVAFSPPATHADVLRWYPAAIATEPFEPVRRKPDACLTAEEADAIREWLVRIEERDPISIAEVLGLCATDEDARGYFLRRAGET